VTSEKSGGQEYAVSVHWFMPDEISKRYLCTCDAQEQAQTCHRSRRMKRSTLKHLGDRLRERMRPEDTEGSEELRKLVEKLEQSERELGRLRIKALKPRSKRPQGRR
jgi:hypothetical protein